MPAHTSSAEALAEALRVNIGLIVRRLRPLAADDGLTMPETATLKRLELSGPTTATALAKLEQISPQSVGAILRALHERTWIKRIADPHDGRQSIVSITAAGRAALRDRRHSKTRRLTQLLTEHFSSAEIERLADVMPLFERLAQRL